MVRHWCCTLVHLHTARTNHTGRITVSRNIKNRTSWAKTWQTVPPHPTYSCGCSISFKQGLTFTQFPLTVNRLPRRTAHPEMTSLCYIWFGAKHPDNMWWSRSAVGGEQRGRRVFVRELEVSSIWRYFWKIKSQSAKIPNTGGPILLQSVCMSPPGV